MKPNNSLASNAQNREAKRPDFFNPFENGASSDNSSSLNLDQNRRDELIYGSWQENLSAPTVVAETEEILKQNDQERISQVRFELGIDTMDAQEAVIEAETIIQEHQSEQPFNIQGEIRFNQSKPQNPIQPKDQYSKSESIFDYIDFSVYKGAFKGVKNVIGFFKGDWFTELIKGDVLGKGQEKTKPEDPKEAEKKQQEALKNRNKQAFYEQSKAGAKPVLSADQKRVLRERIDSTNRERGSKNTNYEGVFNASGTAILRSVEVEIEDRRAEQKSREYAEKMANALKQQPKRVQKGPQRPGAQIQQTNLEMLGGNSRVRGANATG